MILGFFACQAVDHGDRLARVVVMQAQDDHVHAGHQLALGFRVFAFGGINPDHLHSWH